MGDTFSIKQIAEQSGISEDTIRYYEKIGLLPRPKRKGNGHRVYHSADIDIMLIITCLKKTGMSLDEMKLYMQHSSEDDRKTLKERNAVLQDHKNKIKDQMAHLQKIVDLIDYKLENDEKMGTRSDVGVQPTF
jgi:DNA-binding transcriptional MerR regulator